MRSGDEMSDRDLDEIVIEADYGESISFSVSPHCTMCVESMVPYASVHDSGSRATTCVELTFEDVMRLIDWLRDKGWVG